MPGGGGGTSILPNIGQRASTAVVECPGRLIRGTLYTPCSMVNVTRLWSVLQVLSPFLHLFWIIRAFSLSRALLKLHVGILVRSTKLFQVITSSEISA